MPKLTTDKIRNVVLLSHGGAGKTILSESMLSSTGSITRLGRVEDGTTTSDFEPEEIRRGQLECLSCLFPVLRGSPEDGRTALRRDD